jgi:AraC-like DNA-binding protein
MSPRATHPGGSISGRVLLRIADFVTTHGYDAEALYRSLGLSLSALSEPDARVPYPVAESLGERAAELTKDANIGLHLAQYVRDTRAYDAGVLMLMASPSIRVALERMARYQRYWGDGERCTLVPAPGGTCVRYALPGPALGSRRHTDECAMAEIVIGVRFLSAQDLAPRVVRFRHASPPDTREHEALFRCSLEFATAHTEVEFDDATLDLEMQHANEAYCAIFEQQVEHALARLPGQSAMAADVRAIARAALAGGQCTLAGTARMLRVSVRTLQRRLNAEGTSFGELLDALRRELAVAYLAKDVAVQDIAYLLGYADATAFHHAFRRWTGTSPEQARAAGADNTRQNGDGARHAGKI